MAEPVFTRGDLVKNFPTSFSRAALEAHFSSEYVKVIGCSPNLGVIQSLAKHFRALWQILKKKESILTSARGQAFLSVKLPVPVVEKETEKETEKEREKETEKKTEKEREKETEKEKETETEREKEKETESPQQHSRKSLFPVHLPNPFPFPFSCPSV